MTESKIRALDWREPEEDIVLVQFWTPTVLLCEVHGEQTDYMRINDSHFCVTCLEGMFKTVIPVMGNKESGRVLVDLCCEGDITASDPEAISAKEVPEDGNEGRPEGEHCACGGSAQHRQG